MNTIPCKDCITLAICKAYIKTSMTTPLSNLASKCSLIEKYLDFNREGTYIERYVTIVDFLLDKRT